MTEHSPDVSHNKIKFEGMVYDKPLFEAIEANDLDLVRKLLASGSKLDSFNERGYPVVVGAKSEEMFRLLLEFGLDINMPILNGNWTLVHSASTSDEVRLLARLGADLNAINDLGQTPIWSAVNLRDVELLETFVSCGADLNFQETKSRQTILHAAINGYDSKFAKEIVRLGINLSLVNEGGDTALGFLALFSNKRFIDVDHYFELAKMIISRCENVSYTRDSDGVTPLHLACYKDAGRLVAMLLEAGADPTIKTVSGETPLSIAHMHDSYEAIQALADFGITA